LYRYTGWGRGESIILIATAIAQNDDNNKLLSQLADTTSTIARRWSLPIAANNNKNNKRRTYFVFCFDVCSMIV
jgi:hypothetical protein